MAIKRLMPKFCPECGSRQIRRKVVVVEMKLPKPFTRVRKRRYIYHCRSCGLNFKYSRVRFKGEWRVVEEKCQTTG